MKKIYYVICACIVFGLVACNPESANVKGDKKMSEKPQVKITTSMGAFVVELDTDKAPVTTANFLRYVDEKFYDGTIFHRVIPGFVVQGGGMLPGMKEKQNHDPIKNEADNGLSNLRGTIAMARTQVVDSATSQFFINLVDNTRLDHKDKTIPGWGYCVFGIVVEGLDIVDAIAAVKTKDFPVVEGGQAFTFKDVPAADVVLIKAERVK